MRKFDPAAAMGTLTAPPPSTPAPVPAPADAQGFLAKVGTPSAAPPALVPVGGGTTPYVAFRERSTQDKLLNVIVSSLGMVPEGTPVLVSGDKAFRTDGLAFALLDAPGMEPTSYWTTNGPDYKPTRVWLTDPGVKCMPGTTTEDPQGRITEHARALLLVLPGAGTPPSGLSLPIVVSVDFRAAKVQAVKNLATAGAASRSPEWAKQHGKLAQVPPSFRMVGALTTRGGVVKGGPRKGSAYTIANMQCVPVSVAQLEAIGAWAAGDGPRQIEDAGKLHALVLTEIRELAAKTPPIVSGA